MERTHTGPGRIVLKVQGFLMHSPWGRLLGVAVGLGLIGLAFAQPPVRPRREITLTSQEVPLSAAEPKAEQAGSLRFVWGVALRSEDKGFGGLSGLMVEPYERGQKMIAVTDQGDRFTARLVLENDRLRAVEAPTLEPLTNLEGLSISGKLFGDAESITRLPDGRVLVGFERRHRIWAYGPELAGPAKVFETPPALARAPANGGLESLANWPDGRILIITEQLKTEAGNFAAFIFKDRTWAPLEWKGSAPGFEPSDATVLPGGDLLVLERLWSALAPGNLRSRIFRVRGDTVTPGALLQGDLVAELAAPLTTENFEGITSFTNARGATQLLIVSDDNFNGVQRTLLLSFEMVDR